MPLLQIKDAATSQTYQTIYDGNGNLLGLVQRSSGTIAAMYEYSPFGELIRATGTYAGSNPFRFSTKFTDDESGMIYYGRRYYNPVQGRFLGRDPIEEKGGTHLYGFCGNNSINQWDYLGMDPPAGNYDGGIYHEVVVGDDGFIYQLTWNVIDANTENVHWQDVPDSDLIGTIGPDGTWHIGGTGDTRGVPETGGDLIGADMPAPATTAQAKKTAYTAADLLAVINSTPTGHSLITQSHVKVLLDSAKGSRTVGQTVHLNPSMSFEDAVAALAHELGHAWQDAKNWQQGNPKKQTRDEYIKTGIDNEVFADYSQCSIYSELSDKSKMTKSVFQDSVVNAPNYDAATQIIRDRYVGPNAVNHPSTSTNPNETYTDWYGRIWDDANSGNVKKRGGG